MNSLRFSLLLSRLLCAALLLLSFLTPQVRAQPGTGYIQITCAPGVQVFLDGAFTGVTSAEQGGLILTGVSAGSHQLKVRKEGFQPQEDAVRVEAGKVFEFRVQPFTPKLEISQRGLVIPDLGLELVALAPGSFGMGTASGGNNDERPVTRVTLTQPFWLGKTEVTQAQWAAVMGNNPSDFRGEDRPVEQVSWHDAMKFCRKLTERERAAGRLPEGHAYTLPTEAQWEYACRAGTTGDYAGNIDAMGWYYRNSGNTTHAVGQKQANAWGLHDMHGNVWELCLDWYGSYPGGSVTDPSGASSGSYRVRRGGGFGVGAHSCRSGLRYVDLPGTRGRNLGFRLALSSVR